MNIATIFKGDTVVIVAGNKNYTVPRSHKHYDKIVACLKAVATDPKAADELLGYLDITKAISQFSNGKLEIKSGEVFYNGRHFDNSLTKRLLKMQEQGFSVDAMLKFFDNLMLNPSMRSVQELYGFLEKNSLPITEDGHFLAYKKVRRKKVGQGDEAKEIFVDIHSGTMDNSVGKVVEMERNSVDDDSNRTCSSGLHFCSQEYLAHFGSHEDPVVIVKVHPRDVVSIPTDYNNSKARACRYEVIGILGEESIEDKPVVSA